VQFLCLEINKIKIISNKKIFINIAFLFMFLFIVLNQVQLNVFSHFTSFSSLNIFDYTSFISKFYATKEQLLFSQDEGKTM